MLADRAGAAALNRLVGVGGEVLIGNEGRGPWLDLAGRPSGSAQLAGGAAPPELFETADGREMRGVSAAVDGTPWRVLAAFPEATTLEPARALLAEMVLIGLVVLLAAAVGTVVVSGHITRALGGLTSAAERMSRGELAETVAVERGDELGRLAETFNTMAAQLKRGRDTLEAEVAARTRELREALRRLEETQEQLVRREKLAMLGQLASGVGHELRNPLGVMTNAVYYLEAVQVDAPEAVREYLGILRAQITLSEKIVSDLLDFARVKPPEHSPVGLPELVAAQVERLGPLAAVELECAYEPELPPVEVDAVQVGQVVFNVLLNAVQAMGARGGRVTARAWAEGGMVVLEVMDEGPGIAAEDRERIFEPLYTTKARGIGLGLAVTRGLVEANGGRIEADEAPGGGALLRVALPRVSEVAA